MHATKTLVDEHQVILRALACLEVVAVPDSSEPVETCAAIADFLRNYADRLHHAKEEDLLFPAMEAHGIPAEQGPTAVMRMEHEQGRILVRRMLELSGAEEFDRAAFAEAGQEFVALLRAHIGKEDYILYPMAERFVPEPEFSQLATAYEEAEGRVLEAGGRDRYEGWARELATRLGVDQDHYHAAPSCHS